MTDEYHYIGKDGKTVLARNLEDERDALKARIAELEAQCVEVKPLVWSNIGRCVGWSEGNENTHLHSAQSLGRTYEVALGKDGWFAKWKGDYHAKGLPTPESAKQAAQDHHNARVLSQVTTRSASEVKE